MKKKIFFGLYLVLFCLFLFPISHSEAEEPVTKDSLLKVWDFNNGITNYLGGFYNSFVKDASYANTKFNYEVVRGKNGRSLQIDYFKDGGWCGVWMHLFNSDIPESERSFVDSSSYPYISFFVKGKKGGEDFTIQMADVGLLEEEDSLPAGKVSKYLPEGITTEWQEVVVPIEDFVLNTVNPAVLVFNFTEKSKGTVFIDDVYLKKDKTSAIPLSEEGIKTAIKKYNTAMWVWDSLSPLKKDEKRKELLNFCKQHGINELFSQLQYRFFDQGTPKVRCELMYPDEQKAFLKDANAYGIKVHALDGYPEFVLEPWHPTVLAQVKAIIDFNKKNKPDERYYGVHLDNEPYQLLGFGDAVQRDRILKEFLDLSKKCMELVKSSNSNLVYGVDIPFWWDEGEEAGEKPFTVEYNGETKSMAYHVIDLLDNVGIMDYRNIADGADGIIRHCLGEMEYAAKKNRDIYIGVETFKYEPIFIFFLMGLPKDEFYAKMQKTKILADKSQIDGFKVRLLEDGTNVHVGLVAPSDFQEKINDEFKKALFEIASEFSVNLWPDKQKKLDAVLFDAEWGINKNPEYRDFELKEVRDDVSKKLYLGFLTTEVMLDKITFAGYSKSYLNDQLIQAALFFSPYSSFYGFAIHHYETYRAMPEN